MSENSSKPTHRSKGGVEVIVSKQHTGFPCMRVVIPNVRGTGWLLNSPEFDALFEPIPPPGTVTMPLTLARALRADVNRAVRLTLEDSDALESLIAEAEREEPNRA